MQTRVEQALQVIDKCVGRVGWDDVETVGEDLDAADSRHRIGEERRGDRRLMVVRLNGLTCFARKARRSRSPSSQRGC